MKLKMLVLSGLVFAVSSVDVSFAENQNVVTKHASATASVDAKKAEQADAMARLKIEDKSAGGAVSIDKDNSDSRPLFGVNRQLDMRNSSKMRGR
jgi:hypothetical protein